jgi:hypothetical protein
MKIFLILAQMKNLLTAQWKKSFSLQAFWKKSIFFYEVPQNRPLETRKCLPCFLNGFSGYIGILINYTLKNKHL